MKKSLLIIGFACLSSLANAQDSSSVGATTYSYTNTKTVNNDNPTLDKSFIWSIGIEASAPVGHFHEYANLGFGASLQGEIKTSKSIGLTINAGYIAYGGKTDDSIKYSTFKYWPVMGGLKYYMGKAYVHG